MNVEHLLVKAAFRQPTHRRPVWLMRQNGAYLEKYKQLQRKHGYQELCTNVELATELSMLPYELFQLDGISVFSDITLALIPMGLNVKYNHDIAQVYPPVRGSSQVAQLRVPDVGKKMKFLLEIISNLSQFAVDVPVIGMLGGPFTLVAYMIEGIQSKHFQVIKAVMFARPDPLREMLKKTTEMLKMLLQAQIEAGAELVQIYDPWAGILSPADYERFALSYVQELIADTSHKGIPIIYYASPAAGILEQMVQTEADVLALDWRIDMRDARALVGDKVALQGNVDPCILLGNQETIASNIDRLLASYGRAHGLIGGLGHGVLPYIPENNVAFFVRKFQEKSRGYATK